MIYSVVIPSHNEAKNISKLVLKLYKVLKKTKKSFEILVVNDNSTDNTREVLEKLRKRIKELKPIHRKGKKGVGYTKREGFSKAKGKYIITLDGDLSHNPYEIPKFLEAMRDSDMVCGSRYIKGGKAHMNLIRIFISGLFNMLFRKIIGLPIRDFTSGFRVYKKEIIDNIKLKSKGFGIYIEIPIKAHLKGYRLKEIPITYHERLSGESNLSYLKQGPDYLKIVFEAILLKLGIK